MSGKRRAHLRRERVALGERDERSLAISRRKARLECKDPEHIYEARKGEKAQQIGVLDVEQRRLMEAEITRRTIDFMQRQAKASKPFYAYVSFSLMHMPTLPNREFAGKTGMATGPICLAEIRSDRARL
jgi:hypothetical protein